MYRPRADSNSPSKKQLNTDMIHNLPICLSSNIPILALQPQMKQNVASFIPITISNSKMHQLIIYPEAPSIINKMTMFSPFLDSVLPSFLSGEKNNSIVYYQIRNLSRVLKYP